MRLLAIVIAFAGVLLLGINLTTVLDAIKDARTDAQTNTYQVETIAAVTNANVTLSSKLWDDNLASIVYVSSNISEPATANAYNSTTRQLNVVGLAVSQNRTLNVQYLTPSLEGFTSAVTFLNFTPTVYIFGIIGIALAIMLAAFMGT